MADYPRDQFDFNISSAAVINGKVPFLNISGAIEQLDIGGYAIGLVTHHVGRKVSAEAGVLAKWMAPDGFNRTKFR